MPARSVGIIGLEEETGGATDVDDREIDAQAPHPHVRRQKCMDRLCSADYCMEATVVRAGAKLGNTATLFVLSVKQGEEERVPLIGGCSPGWTL